VTNRADYTRKGASQSFRACEIEVLAKICATLARGGDASVLCRHEGFAGVYRKVASMRVKSKAAAGSK